MSDEQVPLMVEQLDIKIAIVAVPAPRAQEVTNMLVDAGVRAILSYAPMVVQVPDGVWIRYIDPVSVLHSMTYYLARELEESKQVHP
jgi:redox-sensing transcriptional repressor